MRPMLPAGVDGASELAAVMREPVHCPPETPIRAALQTMHARRIGSMIVTGGDDMPLGILTLRDILDRIVLADSVLDQPISSVMSTSLHALPPHATVYEAALLMLARDIRHVLVVLQGKLVGVVSEKDLFALQPVSTRHLAAALRGARDTERLVELSAEMRAHARELLLQGTAAEPLTALIASLNDLLVQRVLDLEFAGGEYPAFCWIALGSEGRREQTLLTDQDNAIMFEAGADAEAARTALLPRAQRVNETLARCGFPLCRGGIMAGNPRWCLTAGEWHAQFAHWIDRGDPQALLSSAIFFDFRAVYGERALPEALGAHLSERIRHTPRFLHQMAANALLNRPPIGLLGRFTTSGVDAERRTIDLKLHGAMLFVDAARIYSLAAGTPHTNTCDRLREFARRGRVPPLEVQAWVDAFLLIQVLRLRHQHAQADAGLPLGNRVNPAELNELDSHVLKEALRQARRLQSRLALDYEL